MYETTSVTSVINSNNSGASQGNETLRTQSVNEGSRDAAKQPEKEEVKPEQLEASVKELNSALQSLNVRREFTIEEDINEVVVKIIDSDDKKVIRQIPNEEAVRLSRNIKEMVGLLYDSTS
ncbi:flagellar protein FlaG protein [Denitrovibrio acetiphilus DSM 12809]|jgi:flagellar protein FlaG|uniref:Flagellar protein FlaG protein n=1 Tax=Denitrovibrio acetiphilus (strain DSM 12809 / NBRC 114555 / N2460) TaxID=522772 RepID=D4H3G6_DENA2|nr:flagellar protein FlaG [Denitrovibrio acetiphilus]ADD67250.1 flagellar protein FlaG protein [Denitrovibrio acetiphilus DSM 12809]